MHNKVVVVRCPDYEYKNVETAIGRCIGLLGEDIIPQAKRVLLKPNLLSSTKGPDEPVNTNPVIVSVLARIIKEEYKCRVYIGDSSGGMSYGQTQRAFEVSGLVDVAKRLGVELVNFENTGVINLRNETNRIKKEFPITRFIRDVDFIISLPKLKTHSLVGFTGGVKNMMGLVPGSGKRDMHVSAPKASQMAECIVDLYSLAKPDLCIMDAVVGMEGDGPAAGNSKDIGLILASPDSVALDTVALEIVGYNSRDMVFIKNAQARGLGVGDIKKIEVLGEFLEDVKIDGFRKPISRVRDYINNFVPGFILKTGYAGMTTGRPVINNGLCKQCGECYNNCPVETIEKLPDGRFMINYTNCTECYCCHELCPYNAIEIKLPFSARLVRTGVDVARKILMR